MRNLYIFICKYLIVDYNILKRYSDSDYNYSLICADRHKPKCSSLMYISIHVNTLSGITCLTVIVIVTVMYHQEHRFLVYLMSEMTG